MGKVMSMGGEVIVAGSRRETQAEIDIGSLRDEVGFISQGWVKLHADAERMELSADYCDAQMRVEKFRFRGEYVHGASSRLLVVCEDRVLGEYRDDEIMKAVYHMLAYPNCGTMRGRPKLGSWQAMCWNESARLKLWKKVGVKRPQSA